MTRPATRWALVLVAAVLVSITAGCGSASPSDTPTGMMIRYWGDTHVVNDVIHTNPNGRKLTIASWGSRDKVEYFLFAALPCLDRVVIATGIADRDPGCPPGSALDAALGRPAVPQDPFAVRLALVRHADDRLELIPLFVVVDRHERPVVVDTTGGVFTSLEDFQQHNTLLAGDDEVLIAQDVTAAPGAGPLVVVPGHTGMPSWLLATLIGAGVVVVLAILMAATRLVARRRPSRA